MNAINHDTFEAAIRQAIPDDPNKAPALPTFKRRWWFKDDRLDARLVIWSLRNRPEDWVRGEDYGTYTIKHVPSNHSFWIANGPGFYRLYEANCSCTSSRREFQRFQQRAFGRAYQAWRRHNQPEQLAEQFAAHFVR